MAALQPAHPQQVLHTDQQAAEIGVFGSPRKTRAMIDRHISDVSAFALDHGDQKAVQMIEIGQVQKGLAAERFQPAAGIGGAILSASIATSKDAAACYWNHKRYC